MGYKTYTCAIAKRCGGCEWLAVPYPIQLKRKQKLVEDLLGNAVEADGGTLDEIVGMQEPLAFRHKAATPFAPGRKAPRGSTTLRSGFYASGTHRIVPCESCLVEDPRARLILGEVARQAGLLGIPAYEEDRGTGVLRHAVVRCGFATDDVMLVLVTNGERLPRAERLVAALRSSCPELTTIVQNVNVLRTNAILGRKCKTLWGPGIMHDELLGCAFEIGPTSFYQTNPAQTEALYRLAIEAALGEKDEGGPAHSGKNGALRVLDAYCGTGTIGICLASSASGTDVVGVEQVGGAVACAKRNAVANKVSDRCKFVRADATAYIGDPKLGEKGFDVVLMDPPRAGSTPEFLGRVADLSPERVVYVSCSVTTQARDIELLRARGYRLSRVTTVDMFPHTKHVESVALMTRS